MILADHLHIVDLSMNGIRFQCARRVDMNGIYRIKIERNSISLAMKGQVVRSTLCIEKRGDECVPVYEVAMTFRNLSQEMKKSLEKFISQIGNG